MARKSKGRWLAIILGAGALIAGGAWVARERLGEALFARAVMQNYGRDAYAALPDGLHVVLCGTGSPLPDPTRSGPCTIVVAGKQKFLIDAGSGAGRRMGEMGLPLGALDAAFLTHFHSDHIDGLGEVMLLRWAGGGRSNPLPVHGPQGVEAVVEGYNQAYRADTGYRIAHHGADIVPPGGRGGRAMPFTLPAGKDSRVVFDKDGVRITAIRVNHDPVKPAVGYRFDYKGRSVVVSGDTEATGTLARACNGCDLLVHEALNPAMVGEIERAARARGDNRVAKIMADIPDYHTSPVDAARLAKQGKARTLVFTHIVPQLPGRFLEPAFLKGTKDAFDGPIILGHDGMVFTLPAGGTAIERDNLL